jgi:hypothetical protein
LLEVSQNYPNPFSKVTYLKVNLRYSGPLSVEVWDITGQQVKVVDKGYVTTGSHLFTLDREGLSSGIYFYTVRAGNQLHTGKMTVK